MASKEQDSVYDCEGSNLLPARNGDATAELPMLPPSNCRTSPIEAYTVEAQNSDEPVRKLGAGDSVFMPRFLAQEEADAYLTSLTPEEFGGKGEIDYQQWYHMPHRKSGKLEPLRRTKIAMGRPKDNDPANPMPLYRFPVNDQQRYGIFPFSETVELLRAKVMEVVAKELCVTECPYDFNHSVVLFYKDGQDCIGFHKDKTLDLVEGSPIVSVSLGFARTYVLRDDIFRPTVETRMAFPHGSMFILGAESNEKLYHSIIKEGNADSDGGEIAPRVSITFRAVGTFRRAVEAAETLGAAAITGKGAEYQTGNWPVELRGQHLLLEPNGKEQQNATSTSTTVIAAAAA